MSRTEQRDPGRWGRREVLTVGIGAFVVASLPLAARRPRRLNRRRAPVMGTVAEIAVVHPDARSAHAAIDAALARLHWVDATMSRFRDDSDVGRANARAVADGVPVAPATAAVLAEALAWAESTDGLFDPCVGRAVLLWNVEERSAPPSAADRRRLAGRRLYRHLDIGTWKGRPAVRYTDPDVAIDLGGIAKGYAVDLAAETLRARGIEHALVNVGGDLLALGRSEDGDPWQVGIRSPDDPSRLSGTVALEDEAVATSGDYERFFRWRGRTYHHLLDPRTAAPRVSDAHSLTVVAPTCMRADAAATAVFGAEGTAVARLLATRAPGARVAT
ncbi:MAG: FAD:protein FMN transferase [Planctomycetota bacterium]|jgi:thiamine biosynthesis lipoprotein